VIPGNIIYKQRGTTWFAGENAIMGRDHTIHSAIHGYVKYYRDPAKHPDRQYIGVTYNREDKLPYPPHAMRKRRLSMYAVEMKPRQQVSKVAESGIPNKVIRIDPPAVELRRTGTEKPPRTRHERTRIFRLQDNYSYAESNAALGKLMPRISFAKYREKMRGRQIRAGMKKKTQRKQKARAAEAKGASWKEVRRILKPRKPAPGPIAAAARKLKDQGR
jgi:large subunit ribosomal protein L27